VGLGWRKAIAVGQGDMGKVMARAADRLGRGEERLMEDGRTDTSCIGSVLGKVAVEPCWRGLGDFWQHQGQRQVMIYFILYINYYDFKVFIDYTKIFL